MGRRGGLEIRPPFKPHVPITPEDCFEGFNQWFERYGDSATTRRFKSGGNGSKTSACARCVFSMVHANRDGGPDYCAWCYRMSWLG